MKLPAAALLLLLSLPMSPAFGQKVGETITTEMLGLVDSAKGAQFHEQVNAVAALVRAKRLDEANAAAIELQKRFEGLFDPAMHHYTFQSKEEFQEFKAGSDEAFEWIDWGYHQCLHMQAFVAAERRDFPAALSILTAIEGIAPVSAGAANERGYILNQMGKPDDALVAYQRALLLATRYPSQQPYRALALRGIGFALIELQRLDEAEASFQESLKIDPNNRLALNELTYIRQLRAKAGSQKAAGAL
jgi:tetratricopeptide (TPR) repeat protein